METTDGCEWWLPPHSVVSRAARSRMELVVGVTITAPPLNSGGAALVGEDEFRGQHTAPRGNIADTPASLQLFHRRPSHSAVAAQAPRHRSQLGGECVAPYAAQSLRWQRDRKGSPVRHPPLSLRRWVRSTTWARRTQYAEPGTGVAEHRAGDSDGGARPLSTPGRRCPKSPSNSPSTSRRNVKQWRRWQRSHRRRAVRVGTEGFGEGRSRGKGAQGAGAGRRCAACRAGRRQGDSVDRGSP